MKIEIQDINKIILKVLNIKKNIEGDLKRPEIVNELNKWDSLDHMRIISMIEKKYSIVLSNKNINEMTSSNLILKVLIARSSARPTSYSSINKGHNV
tara:strand:+ start:1281 stop:1571 length:291 start_codon:yes stop_codon:yes gene_type:complete